MTTKDRKDRRAALQTTASSEHLLLESMANATEGLLRGGLGRARINLALAALGSALGAARVYIFESHKESPMGHFLMGLGWQWTSAGVWQEIEKGQFQDMPLSSDAWWYEILSQGKAISLKVEELAPGDAEIFSTKNTHSVLVLPLIIDDRLWGFLGFENQRRAPSWSAMDRSILKAAAGNISKAMAWWQTETKLALLKTEIFREAGVSKISGSHRLCQEICQGEETDKQLCYNICYDRLTKVPNRSLFIEVLKKAILHPQRFANARSQNNPDYFFAVLFLDIDRFKIVKDSLGNLCGDELLISVADRLTSLLRDKDIVPRLGGDEFAVFIDDTKNLKNVKKIAERIKQELTRPFLLNGQEIFTNINIGITISYNGYTQPEEILRDAEIVMSSAKHNGRSSYEIFDAATHKELVGQLKLEHDLRQAVIGLENKKCDLVLEGDRVLSSFELYYQPIVATDTGKILGFEALLRWQHPTLGLISPKDFIPIAEKTGLIIPLGEWVFREACRQLVSWQQQFIEYKHLRVSINLSARQFGCRDLVETIDKIIQETNVDSSSINLEITESSIMEKQELATETLWEFKKRNIKLSIDDFGTGYSSLSCLHTFPLDVLKIDRSFIGKLSLEGKRSQIVQTVVALAHNLGMKVTAEGVETSEELKILQSWGCEFSQGYLFAKPLNIQRAGELLQGKVR